MTGSMELIEIVTSVCVRACVRGRLGKCGFQHGGDAGAGGADEWQQAIVHESEADDGARGEDLRRHLGADISVA